MNTDRSHHSVKIPQKYPSKEHTPVGSPLLKQEGQLKEELSSEKKEFQRWNDKQRRLDTSDNVVKPEEDKPLAGTPTKAAQPAEGTGTGTSAQKAPKPRSKLNSRLLHSRPQTVAGPHGMELIAIGMNRKSRTRHQVKQEKVRRSMFNNLVRGRSPKKKKRTTVHHDPNKFFVQNLSGGQKALHVITDIWSQQYKSVPSEDFILDNRYHRKSEKEKNKMIMDRLNTDQKQKLKEYKKEIQKRFQPMKKGKKFQKRKSKGNRFGAHTSYQKSRGKKKGKKGAKKSLFYIDADQHRQLHTAQRRFRATAHGIRGSKKYFRSQKNIDRAKPSPQILDMFSQKNSTFQTLRMPSMVQTPQTQMQRPYTVYDKMQRANMEQHYLSLMKQIAQTRAKTQQFNHRGKFARGDQLTYFPKFKQSFKKRRNMRNTKSLQSMLQLGDTSSSQSINLNKMLMKIKTQIDSLQKQNNQDEDQYEELDETQLPLPSQRQDQENMLDLQAIAGLQGICIQEQSMEYNFNISHSRRQKNRFNMAIHPRRPKKSDLHPEYYKKPITINKTSAKQCQESDGFLEFMREKRIQLENFIKRDKCKIESIDKGKGLSKRFKVKELLKSSALMFENEPKRISKRNIPKIFTYI